MKKEVKIGSKIIVHADRKFRGIVMPSPDPKVLILKIPSGYNIGIYKKKIKKIEK